MIYGNEGINKYIPSTPGQWRLNGAHPWQSRAEKGFIGRFLVVSDGKRLTRKSLVIQGGEVDNGNFGWSRAVRN